MSGNAPGGRINILFDHAGLGAFAPPGQITEGHFDETFDNDVQGPLFTAQKALPMPDGAAMALNASMALMKFTGLSQRSGIGGGTCYGFRCGR